jgi:hypothetical protein
MSISDDNARLAERRRQRDREMAARIARDIDSETRIDPEDCEWRSPSLPELVERFPDASLRSFLWALERLQ